MDIFYNCILWLYVGGGGLDLCAPRRSRSRVGRYLSWLGFFSFRFNLTPMTNATTDDEVLCVQCAARRQWKNSRRLIIPNIVLLIFQPHTKRTSCIFIICRATYVLCINSTAVGRPVTTVHGGRFGVGGGKRHSGDGAPPSCAVAVDIPRMWCRIG